MQRFLTLAALAALAIGCKGGDSNSTMSQGSSSTTASTSSSSTVSGPVTLKYAPKQGEKYSYLMTASGAASTEIGMTMTCTKVEGDKSTVETTFDSMKMNGQEPPASVLDSFKKMKVITVTDSHGKSLETKVEGAPAGMPTPGSGSMAYPANPIKVGDTWDGTQKMGNTELKSKYKLAKVETVDGKEAATIEVTVEGLPSGITADGPTIYVVEVATGMPISSTSKLKMKGTDGKEVVQTTEMKRR